MTPRRKLNNFKRAQAVFTLVDKRGEHNRNDDGDSHCQRKYLPVARLNRENARQTTNTNAVCHDAVQAAQQSCQARTYHRAQHRKAIFQVDAVHCRLSDSKPGRDSGRHGDLAFIVLATGDDNAHHGGALSNI